MFIIITSIYIFKHQGGAAIMGGKRVSVLLVTSVMSNSATP